MEGKWCHSYRHLDVPMPLGQWQGVSRQHCPSVLLLWCRASAFPPPPPQRRNLWTLQVASRRLQSLFQPRCNLSQDFNLFKLRVSVCFSLAAGLAKATQELHTASLQQANFCCRLHLCKQDVFRLLPKHQLCKLIIFSQHPTPTWVTSLVLTKLQNGDCGHYLTFLLFMMYEGKSRGSSFQITSSVCLAGS